MNSEKTIYVSSVKAAKKAAIATTSSIALFHALDGLKGEEEAALARVVRAELTRRADDQTLKPNARQHAKDYKTLVEATHPASKEGSADATITHILVAPAEATMKEVPISKASPFQVVAWVNAAETLEEMCERAESAGAAFRARYGDSNPANGLASNARNALLVADVMESFATAIKTDRQIQADKAATKKANAPKKGK